MEKQFFVGKKAVAQLIDTGKVTPMKGKLLKVVYEDGSVDIMPEKRYVTIRTDAASDSTTVRTNLVLAASKEVSALVYAILLEWGLRLSEVDVVTSHVSAMINANSEKASNLLWGVDYADERTLIMINDILLENVSKQQNNDGSPSEGEGASS